MTETRWRCTKCKVYVPTERVQMLPIGTLDKEERIKMLLMWRVAIDWNKVDETPQDPIPMHEVWIRESYGHGRIGCNSYTVKCGPLERYEVQDQELFVEWLEASV